MIALFNAYEVDMIVMAGWMKVVSKNSVMSLQDVL